MAKATPDPEHTVFRVQRPDGSYRGGGHGGKLQRGGKVWTRASHVKNHFRQHAIFKDDAERVVRLADAEGDVVIEYALVEVRRTPVREFLNGGES